MCCLFNMRKSYFANHSTKYHAKVRAYKLMLLANHQVVNQKAVYDSLLKATQDLGAVLRPKLPIR